MQERVTDLVGKSTDAGKKVYGATMYIPNMALHLSGEVIVSAKQLVFALNEVKFKLQLNLYDKFLTPNYPTFLNSSLIHKPNMTGLSVIYIILSSLILFKKNVPFLHNVHVYCRVFLRSVTTPPSVIVILDLALLEGP